MRCQCLVSNLLRRYVGKCGEYVVVKVRRSLASCFFFVSVFCLSGNLIPLMLLSYDLLSVSSFLHVFDMLLCISGT